MLLRPSEFNVLALSVTVLTSRGSHSLRPKRHDANETVPPVLVWALSHGHLSQVACQPRLLTKECGMGIGLEAFHKPSDIYLTAMGNRNCLK